MRKLISILGVLAVAACSGDVGPTGLAGPAGPQGPPGPQGATGTPSVLAFGDIDAFLGAVNLLSSGPAGVIVTPSWLADHNVLITIGGSFPAATGVLLVSISRMQESIPVMQLQ